MAAGDIAAVMPPHKAALRRSLTHGNPRVKQKLSETLRFVSSTAGFLVGDLLEVVDLYTGSLVKPVPDNAPSLPRLPEASPTSVKRAYSPAKAPSPAHREAATPRTDTPLVVPPLVMEGLQLTLISSPSPKRCSPGRSPAPPPAQDGPTDDGESVVPPSLPAPSSPPPSPNRFAHVRIRPVSMDDSDGPHGWVSPLRPLPLPSGGQSSPPQQSPRPPVPVSVDTFPAVLPPQPRRQAIPSPMDRTKAAYGITPSHQRRRGSPRAGAGLGTPVPPLVLATYAFPQRPTFMKAGVSPPKGQRHAVTPSPIRRRPVKPRSSSSRGGGGGHAKRGTSNPLSPGQPTNPVIGLAPPPSEPGNHDIAPPRAASSASESSRSAVYTPPNDTLDRVASCAALSVVGSLDGAPTPRPDSCRSPHTASVASFATVPSCEDVAVRAPVAPIALISPVVESELRSAPSPLPAPNVRVAAIPGGSSSSEGLAPSAPDARTASSGTARVCSAVSSVSTNDPDSSASVNTAPASLLQISVEAVAPAATPPIPTPPAAAAVKRIGREEPATVKVIVDGVEKVLTRRQWIIYQGTLPGAGVKSSVTEDSHAGGPPPASTRRTPPPSLPSSQAAPVTAAAPQPSSRPGTRYPTPSSSKGEFSQPLSLPPAPDGTTVDRTLAMRPIPKSVPPIPGTRPMSAVVARPRSVSPRRPASGSNAHHTAADAMPFRVLSSPADALQSQA